MNKPMRNLTKTSLVAAAAFMTAGFSPSARASDAPDCGPVLQKQMAALMNAQSGWKLKPADISVGSLVEGLFTVVAGPKAGQPGAEYLVAIWDENDCRITSLVEAKDETAAETVTWKKGQ